MFTQCSNCHTVFQLSAEVLRAAGGQVRCGRCGEIFSALARLAEDANSFDTGESAYDMEERADSILESVVADQVAQALPEDSDEENVAGSEIARLQVIDFTDEDLIEEDSLDEAPEQEATEEEPQGEDAAMEYTLPPTELDRIFIEPKIGMPSFTPPDGAPMSTSAEAAPPLTPTPPLVSAPPTPPAVSAPHAPASPASAPPASAPPESAPPESAPPESAEEDGPLPDIEVISDTRTSYDLRAPPQPSSRAFALWGGAAVVSALLLLGQVVHRNRESLTAQGPLAPALRLLYAALGTRVDAAPNLAVYQLRQWGVTGEPGAGQPGAGQPGAGTTVAGTTGTGTTLRVRASILNTSALLQPFPLLRLTLANRYGATLGTRDFAPSEYMGGPIARALSPGETVDAILNIVDPGKDAEGFEIDVCLRGTGQKIICANDAAPAQRKP